jgi:hypothetical protein
MVMEHGTISMTLMTRGIGTMAGVMVGLGDPGIAGMAVYGDGVVLMSGHIGDGDQVGVVQFITLLIIAMSCLVGLTLHVDICLQVIESAPTPWVAVI